MLLKGSIALLQKIAGAFERSPHGFDYLEFDARRGDNSPRHLEAVAGFRHYLSCLGIDVPCHPRRRARSTAVSAGGNTISRCRNRALRVDAGASHTFAHAP